MKQCCRDTVAILSAAAAVWGCPATRSILSSLQRVQEPCEACSHVASTLRQDTSNTRDIEARPSEAMLVLGNAIAYVLEGNR